MNTNRSFSIRLAKQADVDALYALENASFAFDKLSKRRLRHWVSAANAILLAAFEHPTTHLGANSELSQKQAQQSPVKLTETGTLMGYALVIMRKGSRSARLYSIATDTRARGHKLGEQLLSKAESLAVEKGVLFMRLEVAIDNTHAISLYEAMGYKQFGIYHQYYENSMDALRMQKPIKQLYSKTSLPQYPWYQQTTEFTCGAASLMMASSALNAPLELDQFTELDIWRQATSIYMTSGHGGSHPIGLALAAKSLGLQSEVFINIEQTPFIDGVRSTHKKQLLSSVHEQFCMKASKAGIEVHYAEPDIADLKDALQKDSAVICLISTYQFDGKKIPHWVAITHIDDTCLYIHDPDIEENDNPMDFQHIPIAIEDFTAMATYGKQKLRTCLVISKAQSVA
ncbi:GNAT family N-acetyltransferase/peptidase C39 family protein [Glaciecola siphonariae]|uniref:GNAT family N-acetyltransferase/peptidase C39 family protein n=1 Tax=Glaciecola siphonariae TaxID=521012 RepID=A0ABV9LRX2_9ALTE